MAVKPRLWDAVTPLAGWQGRGVVKIEIGQKKKKLRWWPALLCVRTFTFYFHTLHFTPSTFQPVCPWCDWIWTGHFPDWFFPRRFYFVPVYSRGFLCVVKRNAPWNLHSSYRLLSSLPFLRFFPLVVMRYSPLNFCISNRGFFRLSCKQLQVPFGCCFGFHNIFLIYVYYVLYQGLLNLDDGDYLNSCTILSGHRYRKIHG